MPWSCHHPGLDADLGSAVAPAGMTGAELDQLDDDTVTAIEQWVYPGDAW